MKRLVRKREGAMLTGLCSGLADYWNVDVTVVRLGAVLFGLVGAGVLFYIIASFVVPGS